MSKTLQGHRIKLKRKKEKKRKTKGSATAEKLHDSIATHTVLERNFT